MSAANFIDYSNPCQPKISGPVVPPLQLADAIGRVQSAVTGDLTALQAAGNDITARFNVLATDLSALGKLADSLAASAVPSINGALAKALVDNLANQAINAAKSVVAGVVSAELNKITNIAVSELRKDMAPVFVAISAISNALGKLEADKALAQAALNSLDCPAKAEMLAEAYFKRNR